MDWQGFKEKEEGKQAKRDKKGGKRGHTDHWEKSLTAKPSICFEAAFWKVWGGGSNLKFASNAGGRTACFAKGIVLRKKKILVGGSSVTSKGKGELKRT